MTNDHGDPGAVEQRLDALESRVAALEAGRGEPEPPRPDVSRSGPDRFWALEVLQERSGAPFEDGRSRGSLVYAGSLTAPGVGTLAWQIERPVPWMLAQDWAPAATPLAALGTPVRLEIIRRLLDGARTSQDLQEIADLGTTGRLYHHLRELQACGLIVSPRRNTYAIPPQKVVPCMVIVAAADELATPVGVEKGDDAGAR